MQTDLETIHYMQLEPDFQKHSAFISKYKQEIVLFVQFPSKYLPLFHV